MRFFLYASTQGKVRRLVSERNSQRDAEQQVDTVDHERAAFIREYFYAEWPSRAIYHAMFNTDVGEQAVVQAISDFLRRRQSTSLAAD